MKEKELRAGIRRMLRVILECSRTGSSTGTQEVILTQLVTLTNLSR